MLHLPLKLPHSTLPGNKNSRGFRFSMVRILISVLNVTSLGMCRWVGRCEGQSPKNLVCVSALLTGKFLRVHTKLAIK